MRYETVTVSCDKCGNKLPGDSNINIVTTLSENTSWQRLHVRIENHKGYHNTSTTTNADLCQDCAVALLSDAVFRIKQGERVSKGVESIEQKTYASTT